MRFLYLLLACLLPTLASTQPTPGFQRLPSGLEYQLFRRDAAGHYQRHTLTSADAASYQGRVGKFLLAHTRILTGKGKVLESSRQMLHNRPAPVPLLKVAKKGGQEEALSLLRAGDSAVFRFSVAALALAAGNLPPEVKRDGNVLVLQVTAVKLISAAEASKQQAELQALMLQHYQQEQARQAGPQLEKDEAAILAFLNARHLSGVKKTAGGVYYLVTRPGTGPVPKPGQLVTVQYTGSLLNGKVFDSSAQHGGQPLTFAVGTGQVIAGWDQALLLLPKGSEATLLIPSTLAYGAQGSGASIPPNAPLCFAVEVVDVKPAPAPAGIR